MENGTTGVEFDRYGNLIKSRARYPAFGNKILGFDKRLVISFLGTCKIGFSDNLKCQFEIKVPEGIDADEIARVREWVNSKVKLEEGSKTILERKRYTNMSPDNYILKIVGKGSDDRCRWCRSFRTLLTTRMNRNECDVFQEGFCYFER